MELKPEILKLNSAPRQPARSVSYSLDTVAQMNISEVETVVFKRYLEKQLKRSLRLKERREVKKEFGKKLRRLGHTDEADRLEKCCANFQTLMCANGHSFNAIPDFRCHLPFCPDCWETKAHRSLSENLPKFLQALRDNPSLIVAFSTFTIKSERERELRAGCKKIKADFKKLRKRKIWSNCVGGLGRIENTFSKKFGWHPHLHSILLLKNHIPQKSLSDGWRDVTKDSMVVDIRTVHDVAAGLVECIKYPFKPADLKKLGKNEIQQMLALKGEKLGVPFGVIFGVETDDDIENELKDDYSEFCEENKTLEVGSPCPICAEKLDLVGFTADFYTSFLASVPVKLKARGHPL